jgi:DNA-binding LacI/PurR family transcriptional regulator
MLVETGITALVCSSARDARQTSENLTARGFAIPQQVSLVAVGCACGAAQCSGYFVACEEIAKSVVDLLSNSHPRPVSLWLPGQWVERGTLAPIGAGLQVDQANPLRVSGVMV